MYLLFRLHHWKPEDYYRMGYGQRMVVKKMLYQELEERNEEVESIGEQNH